MKEKKWRFAKMRSHNAKNVKFVHPFKIVVATEADKKQLLEASYTIHNFQELDTDLVPLNLLAHIYITPWMIEVNPKAKFPKAK